MKNRQIARNLLAWFAESARPLPWRRTRDPYAIWVSEVMLQQTQVKTVLPYWERWMRALPNVEALAKARPARLHKLWEGLGYYTRVRNLQRAARVIREKYAGRFPRSFEDVLGLPGIGRYTAGAICSIAFNQPRPVLDGNVMRVLARVYGVAGDPRERAVNTRLWALAEDLVRCAAKLKAQRGCSALNQSLMELGAVVCTPQQPRCEACPVSKQCVACREGRVKELPGRRQRARVTARRFVAFVAQRDGRFLVRQRPAGVVNAHLWEFPNVEVAPGDADLKGAARKILGVRSVRLEPLTTIKHSITRYRITLEAYRVTPGRKGRRRKTKERWVERRQLERLAFSSAHKRLLQVAVFGRRQDGPGA